MDARVHEQKIRRLEFQNKRLAEKVGVQKGEIAELQKRIDAQEKRWSTAQTAVLAVRRGWKQLNEDLSDVGESASLELDQTPSDGNPFLDPLLTALLKPFSVESSTSDSVQESVQTSEALSTETDREIKRQADQTMQMMTRILQRLQSGAPSVDPDEASGADLNKAEQRALKERAEIAEDKIQRLETKMKETQSHLMDTKIQLETAQRKILSYKNTDQEEAPQSKPPPESSPPEETKLETAPPSKETLEERKELMKICVDSIADSLTAELEKERQAHFKTQKQLRQAESKCGIDDRVMETKPYKTLMDQKHQLTADVERLRREVERLEYVLQSKEVELSKKGTSGGGPQDKIDAFLSRKEAHKRLAELQKHVNKTDRLIASDASFKTTLPQSTIDEFQAMVKQAQDETSRCKRRLKEAEESEMLMKKAREESIDAGKKLRRAQNEMDELRQKTKDVISAREQSAIVEGKLREQNEDLRVFIDVLATCEISSRHWNEADSKKREKSVLRENESLKRKLEKMEAPVPDKKEMQQELKRVRERLQAATTQLQEVQGQLDEHARKSQHLTDDLSQQKGLNVALEQELEQTGQAYEESQAQSAKLLTQVSHKDVNILNIKRQLARSTSRVEELTSLLKNLGEKERSNNDDGKELEGIKFDFQKRIDILSTEITKTKQEIESLNKELCEARAETSRQRSAKKEVEMQLEAVQQTGEERKRVLDVEIDRHLTERSKRQKLESDVKAFEAIKKKMREGTLSKGDLSDEHDIAILNKEVESLRRCINCSVCGMEAKSVVLLKCMHTFCKSCIDNRIETRSRRCPGCGTPFSREDVRPFYLS